MRFWLQSTQPPGHTARAWDPGTCEQWSRPSLAPADRMWVPLSWPVLGRLQFHNAVIAGNPWEQKHRVSFMRFRHSKNERCLANSILDIPLFHILFFVRLIRCIDIQIDILFDCIET